MIKFVSAIAVFTYKGILILILMVIDIIILASVPIR